MKILVLAYGNPWRQDDGAGLRVLNALNQRLGLSGFSEEGQILDENRGAVYVADDLEVETRFVYQLDMDLAEAVSGVDQVLFIDAHRDKEEEPIQCVPVEPGYEATFTFHHLTPADLLGLAQMAYGRAPQARLYSVQGWQFNHGSQLSPDTAQHVPALAGRILAELFPAGTEGPSQLSLP